MVAVRLAGSQAELAKVTGVTRSAVYYWVKRNVCPSPQAILRIEKAYGIPKEDLLPEVFAPDRGQSA